jgi:hypothetical protein
VEIADVFFRAGVGASCEKMRTVPRLTADMRADSLRFKNKPNQAMVAPSRGGSCQMRY